ncbi:MAG: bifunctional metallophosphatase/5'-nucleotidase [Oscillospiraceae bacterium]|nr:bifunctional metallophosphatase/5'-nucleotidase [Oscillospiraceae bacterium]
MKNKKVFIVLAVVIVLAIIVLAVYVPKTKEIKEATVTIYHTNDMHANLIGDPAEGEPNLAVIAAIANEDPEAILVDAGDALQGQPYCLMSNGLDIIKLMNAAGYDAMAVGNHEFDYGIDAMYTNFGSAEFPVLAANLQFTGESSKLDDVIGDFTVITSNGKNIAFIGLAGLDTLSTVAPGSREGITFEDYLETLNRVEEDLKAWEKENHKAVDYKIILSHLGDAMEDPDNPYWSNNLAERGIDIDLIIDGHAHSYLLGDRALNVNGVTIVSAGGYLSSLGKVDLHFNKDGSVDITSSDAMPYSFDANTPQDADTLKVIEEVRKSQEQLETVVIGQAVDYLDWDVINALTADAMRWQAEQDIHDKDALILGYICDGNVRAEIDKGEITMGNAFEVLPWGNEIKYIEINPNILYQMVEVGLRYAFVEDDGTASTGGCGAFLIGSGFRYEADLTKIPTVVDDEAEVQVVEGQRVKRIILDDGTVLDRNDTSTRIIMGTSGDYNITGGDGFYCLVDNCKVLDFVGISQEQALAQYLGELMHEPGFENGIKVSLLDLDRYLLSTEPLA